uniref:Protein MIS12 homolog n=1 Tax=Tanacetum cinerariifolium TaxID=118510 RepID=A0A699JYW2_TANCI|nr:protein MIS12 homolog [Tanacetum cinerariifolium]
MEGSGSEATFDSMNLNPQLSINATLNILNELIDSAFDHLDSEAYAQLKIQGSERLPMATVDINGPSICNSEHYGYTIHATNAGTSSDWQSGSCTCVNSFSIDSVNGGVMVFSVGRCRGGVPVKMTGVTGDKHLCSGTASSGQKKKVQGCSDVSCGFTQLWLWIWFVSGERKRYKRVTLFSWSVERPLGTSLIGKRYGCRGRGSGRSRDGSERVQRGAMVYVTGVVKNQKRLS